MLGRASRISWGIVIAASAACGGVLGLEQLTYDDETRMSDAGTGTDSSSSESSTAAKPDASVTPMPSDGSSNADVEAPVGPEGPCDATEVSDPNGIYVSERLGADSGSGTAGTPARSLGFALGLVNDTRRTIYIAEGTYHEAQTLPVGAAQPLRVTGGWVEGVTTWTKRCDPGRRLRTRIMVAHSRALTDVAGTDGAVMLASLTVMSTASSPEGSSYAVFLGHSNAAWTIADTALIAERGRNGATPVPPPTLARAGPCGSHCSTGAHGTVGANASPGPPGVFNETGFVIGNGLPGAFGTFGLNGTPGQPVSALSFVGGSCTGDMDCASKTRKIVVSTTPGSCGCGGQGGAGGGGGEGGGASVALFVSGARTIELKYAQLSTRGGGDGAGGGAGAAGQLGGFGAVGGYATYDARECVKDNQSGNCRANGASTAVPFGPGASGGPGGNGGAGGIGSGGAGGASVGIVVRGATIMIGSGVTFEIANAGLGAPDAVAGVQADTLDGGG